MVQIKDELTWYAIAYICITVPCYACKRFLWNIPSYNKWKLVWLFIIYFLVPRSTSWHWRKALGGIWSKARVNKMLMIGYLMCDASLARPSYSQYSFVLFIFQHLKCWRARSMDRPVTCGALVSSPISCELVITFSMTVAVKLNILELIKYHICIFSKAKLILPILKCVPWIG